MVELEIKIQDKQIN